MLGILVFVLVDVGNPARKVDIIVGVVVVAFAMAVEVLMSGGFVKVAMEMVVDQKGNQGYD